MVAVFSYSPVIHDVVEVHKEDYPACDISHPIKTHNDGETVVPLDKQGRRYFVCGHQGHCSMGLKLEVEVLPPLSEDQNNGGGGGKPKSPPSSPSSPSSRPDGPNNSSSSGASGPDPCPCSGGSELLATPAFFGWLIPLV